MFLHELTDPQREAFLCIAARCTSADAQLHDAELAMLTHMREEMGVRTWTPSPVSTAALLERFDTPRARAVVGLELLRLARADGALHPEEIAFFQEAAQGLQLSRAKVKRMARWLMLHERLMAEAELLLSEP